MTIVQIFVNFINNVLGFKIYGIQLISWLLAFSFAIVIFKIIEILANSEKKNKKD